MPSGLESGKTWSPIGAQATVSTSAASRVWTLNEVAAYEGAGTWPAPPADYEVIAQYLGDSTSTVITFDSIPQNYRHLRIVMGPAIRDSQGASPSIMFNNDNTQANYGVWLVREAYSIQGSAGVNNWNPIGDLPTYTHGTMATFDIPGYSNTAIGASLQAFLGARIAGSGLGGYVGFGGQGYDQTGAITRIDFFYMYSTGTNYDYKAPTSVTLFGIGTAD